MEYEVNVEGKDKKSYTISIDDEGQEIVVSHDGVKLGSISLDYREGNEYAGTDDHYHITHLALDACKGLGLGRQCLEFHIDNFDCILTAGTSGMGKANDGSHLTGDGPGFVEAMRKAGIISR